ncbi:MAG: O-antigen ligase family protein [Eubacteriales bacterium]|nr:O-antigen ligase family protein [Eubacteriales bacterium]
MFDENKLILYDTFVLFFFVYPLGHYIAKWKESVLFRAFLNIFLLAVSVFMLIVIIYVFQGKTIEVPSGSPIEMALSTSTRRPYYRLAISCNPNGSGSAEAIAFLTSLVLLFRNTTIPGKVLAVFFVIINYTGLVLTGSRTALAISLIGSVIMVFLFCTSSRVWRTDDKKKARAVIISLLVLFVLLLSRHLIFEHAQSLYHSLEDSSASIGDSLSYAQTPVLSAHQDHAIANRPSFQDSFVQASKEGSIRYITNACTASTVSTNMAAEVTRSVPDLPAAAQGEGTSPGVLYTKLNSLLSGRLPIWKIAVKAITSSPQTLRYGVTPDFIFSSMNEAAGYKLQMYTHNQFLEIALALGIPSLLLFIIFILYTILNCVRLFKYSESEPINLLLPVFFMVLLLSNMTEAFLMFHRFVASTTFFFVCGWINERGILVSIRHKKRQSEKLDSTTARLHQASL